MALARPEWAGTVAAAAAPVRRFRWLPMAVGGLAMLLAVVAIGLPIYWMAVASFKTLREIYHMPPTWIPLHPTLANYPAAFRAASFARYFWNSLLTTALGAGAKVALAITTAYALAFLRFPGRNLVFSLILVGLMVPPEITILPNYLLVAHLGWVNTYAGIIVPGVASAFATFLLRQYFLTLPGEIIDAAHLDGAGHLRILWNVVLPLARPAVATVALLSLAAKWNEFLWPLVVTTTAQMRTLPIGLYWLLDQEGTTQWGVVMAGTLLALLPVILLFLWTQRYIVAGLFAGSGK